MRSRRPSEAIRGSGRLELGNLTIPWIHRVLADRRPASLRKLLLAEHGGKFPEASVEANLVRVAEVEAVADRTKQTEVVAAAKAPSRRRQQPHRDRGARRSRCQVAIEGFAKHRQVVTRGSFDAPCEPGVKAPFRRHRKRHSRGFADQVVGDERCSRDAKSEASRYELERRLDNSTCFPAQDSRRFVVVEGPSTNRENRQEGSCVRAEIPKPLDGHARWFGTRPAAGECLYPEGRAAGSAPKVACNRAIELLVDRLGESATVVERERTEIDDRPALGWHIRLDAAANCRRSGRWPREGDERRGLTCRRGRVENLLDEGERSLIHPLEIIDCNEDRTLGCKSPMGRFEDAEWVTIFRCVSPKHEPIEDRSITWHFCQVAEQCSRGG